MLHCICLVIVEAFNHNSITKRNKFSSQVLFRLTYLPHSLLSHSFPCLSDFCLTHSPHSLTSCLHSPISLSHYSVILTHLTHSYVSLFINLSLLASPSCLSYSLPHLFSHSSCLTHSLIPMPDSLSVSLILCLAHFPATHFLTYSLPCIILSHLLHCLTHSLHHLLPHLLPCLTYSLLTPLAYSCIPSHSLTNSPTSLTPASLTHSLIHSLLQPPSASLTP